LLPIIEQYSKQHEFTEIIPFQRKHEGLDVLQDKLIARYRMGPVFSRDQVTNPAGASSWRRNYPRATADGDQRRSAALW
jgi:hypothetical protein